MSVSVSETIGKLLLEGYKMLADSCEVCSTVLMQDRRGRVICVQCESASMANAAQESMNPSSGSGKQMNGNAALNNFNNDNTTTQRNITNGPTNNVSSANNRAIATNSPFSNCEEALTKEIQNATSTLQLLSQQRQDIHIKSSYVKYIRECAETLLAVKALSLKKE